MDFNADSLRKVYLEWVKENSYKDLNNEWVEIKTPFTDLTGSYIYLFAKQIGDKIYLTDYGNTLNELELNKIELKRTRKELFNNILLTNGCKLGKELNDIYTDFYDILDFPIRKHQLIQAIINVNDLNLISKNNVKSMFISDIMEYLDDNNIIYSDRVYSISGKSTLPNQFDLSVGKVKRKDLPQIHIRVINQLNKNNVKMLLFAKDDLDLKDNERIATIINSDNKINRENTQILKSRDIDVIESKFIDDYFEPYKMIMN